MTYFATLIGYVILGLAAIALTMVGLQALWATIQTASVLLFIAVATTKHRAWGRIWARFKENQVHWPWWRQPLLGAGALWTLFFIGDAPESFGLDEAGDSVWLGAFHWRLK